jgi:hypothetical protein
MPMLCADSLAQRVEVHPELWGNRAASLTPGCKRLFAATQRRRAQRSADTSSWLRRVWPGHSASGTRSSAGSSCYSGVRGGFRAEGRLNVAPFGCELELGDNSPDKRLATRTNRGEAAQPAAFAYT